MYNQKGLLKVNKMLTLKIFTNTVFVLCCSTLMSIFWSLNNLNVTKKNKTLASSMSEVDFKLSNQKLASHCKQQFSVMIRN